jgi:hypothetical protein
MTEVPLIRCHFQGRMSETPATSPTSNTKGDGWKGAVVAKRGPVEDVHGNSEVQQEATKIRRLQIMISMVMSVISQDPNLTVEEASELVAGTKRAALAMFPDKELAYDIIYRPRLQRLMKERFHLQ